MLELRLFGGLDILLRALEGNLSPHERGLLIADSEWSISAIVLWEIAKLHQLGRAQYGLDQHLAAALDLLHIWPITREICLKLGSLDFHSDPAGEIIAATSLTHNVPLMTRDNRIRRSKLVKFA